jgi:lysophospholipase L1-like esterase
MQTIVLVLVALLGISSLLFFVRLARTGVLILVVSSYQRDLGEGAPAILVAGDSTAYGTGALSNTNTVAGRIATDFPTYSVRTIAQNGATVADLYALLGGSNLKDKYAFVVLQIGGNDVLQGKDLTQSAQQLTQMLHLLKTKTDTVYIMTAGNIGAASAFVKNGVPDAGRQSQSLVLRDLFTQVAQAEGAIYVDLYEDPALDIFLKEPGTYLAFDGLHPSGVGYGFWYKKLQPLLPLAQPQ